MSKVLLINPSHRPTRRKARKTASPAQRRARAAFAAAARARAKNPARRRRAVVRHAGHHVTRRRRNPIHALARRSPARRRNPISLGGGTKGIVAMLKHAAIGGAGAVVMDVIMGQLNKHLPASLKSDASTVGVGDAVKAAATVLLAQVLRKPTRGLSTQLAQGALIVQAADIMRSFVPDTMTMGYYSPGRVVRGTPRIAPNAQQMAPGMARYLPSNGNTPLLSRYMQPGNTQLLSANGSRSNSNVRIR